MAFRIRLALQYEEFFGIEAVEESRRAGVAEETQLSYENRGGESWARHPELAVTEAFARRWFGRSQTVSEVTVPVSLIQPGDVERLRDYSWVVRFVELPDTRIIELYESARIRGLSEENSRLQSELEELRQSSEV